MKRAVVTGAAGFAGRHYVQALLDLGYEVDEVDRNGRIASRQTAQFFFGNPTGWHYDLVVHCAAVVGGRAVIDGRPLDLAANLELDSLLFQWAAEEKPGRVLYISSSAAYPVDLQTQAMADKGRRLREGDIAWHRTGVVGLPDQLYGWAKITGEMLAARCREAGVPVTVVRPFSGYGEDQNVAYPFPAFVARAAAREDPFTIWGDGRQNRDWIHIDDVVGASLWLAMNGFEGPVNLGTGVATSMYELAGRICAASGYTPEFQIDRDAPMGVRHRVADVTLLSTLYECKISLEEGIARAVRFSQARPAPRVG